MRVIVLWSWPNDRAFVVVVILIADVPVEPLVQLDCESSFRRLITHRIRRDQRSRIPRGISDSIPLTVVFVDSISREERHPRSNTGHRLNEEEVVPDEVETVTKQMLNVIEEVIEFRVAVYPVVVVAGADREPRGCSPVE